MGKRYGGTTTPFLSFKVQTALFLLALVLAFQTFFLTYKIGTLTSTTFAIDGRSTSTSSDPHEIGQILPGGTVTFTPEEFQAGRPDKYVNLPNVPVDLIQDHEVIQQLMTKPVPKPTEILLHEAPAPPGSNAIVGLASYPKFMEGWRRLVGSLRLNGYDGHIIVGVNPAIPEEERKYLDRMGVTYYAIEVANCSASILEGVSKTDNAVRARCSLGLEDLKVRMLLKCIDFSLLWH